MPLDTAPRARVLFVDDEPRILTSLRMLFRTDYHVRIADSGAMALQMLKNEPVDVIVSDQRMPGMTGVEVLRAARDVVPGAMRILLTGYSDLNAIIGSINEGEIFRFVNKPWANEELASTVASAVAAARASHAAATRADATPSAAAPAAVLVLDDDPSVPGQIQNVLDNSCRVVGVTKLEQAVEALERENIGVVISDTRVDKHPVIELLGTLKKHHPQLVSVILTGHADAGSAIGLINQGQIYRYVLKPIHVTQCKIALNSAIKQHQRLIASPELHKRYEVQAAAPSAQAAAAPVAAGLLNRIRSLRALVGGRA